MTPPAKPTLREVVARAICEHDGHNWPDEHKGTPMDYNDNFQRNVFLGQADAAIAAVVSDLKEWDTENFAEFWLAAWQAERLKGEQIKPSASAGSPPDRQR